MLMWLETLIVEVETITLVALKGRYRLSLCAWTAMFVILNVIYTNRSGFLDSCRNIAALSKICIKTFFEEENL